MYFLLKLSALLGSFKTPQEKIGKVGCRQSYKKIFEVAFAAWGTGNFAFFIIILCCTYVNMYAVA